MRIKAKFKSVCPDCQTPIAPQTMIEWTRGQPARHAECADAMLPTQTCADCGAVIGPKAAAWDVTRAGEAKRVVCTKCKGVRAKVRMARTAARFPGWNAEQGWSVERTEEQMKNLAAGHAADGRSWDEVEMDARFAVAEREAEAAGFLSDPDYRKAQAAHTAQMKRRVPAKGTGSTYREALKLGDPELVRQALDGSLD